MSEEARQQVTLLGAETARLQAQVASLQRAVSINIPGKPVEQHLQFLHNSQERSQSRPFASDSLQQKATVSRSPTVGHYSQTPSVSSSDTESILMSEVEFKVLPSHSSHSNSKR